MRYAAAPEPTFEAGQGTELEDTWQRQSPPRQRGEVQSHGTRGGSGARLSREAWSRATGHLAACECMPCFLS
jgi:hypothetical protein